MRARRRRIAVAILALVAGAGPAAADVNVRAYVEQPMLRAGDTTTLAVEVRGTQDVPAPAVPAVDGLSIRYTGPATQVSIANGQMSTSITHRYTVATLRTGTFSIGPIEVEAGGTRHRTGPVQLQVAAAGRAAPAAGAREQQLRLTLAPAKPRAYLHERVPVTITLWVGSVRVGDIQYPALTADGFALDAYEQPVQRRRQTPEGTFQTVAFRTVLTPLRSGTLTIGPATLDLSLVIEQRRRDRFFGGLFGTQREPVTLTSEALTLDVAPLPEAGKPADFSGAVGRFTFEVAAAPREVAAGDPVTLTMTIRGDGNLEQLRAPVLRAPDVWRPYPIQETTSPEERSAGGTKTFEQVLIPNQPGARALTPPAFSYFDPEAARYETVQPSPLTFTVRAGADRQAESQVVGAPPAAAPETPLGRDIVFIKDAPGTLSAVGRRLHRSPWFWAYQPLPLLGWLAVVLVDRRRRRLLGDHAYARFTRAGREARRALDEAQAALRAGDRSTFYDRVARAVSDYLSAKLALPPGGVSAGSVAARVRGAGLAVDTARDLEAFFAVCERVRFAPDSADGADHEATLARARAIVRAFERDRRLASRRAGLAASRGALGALVVAAAATGALVSAAADDESPSAHFFRGNAFYSAEQYDHAIAAYEQVLARGVESGALHFNLGNAYFKTGDLGHAILSYERARRLLPGDPDLAANLAYARSESGVTIHEPLWARLAFPLAGRQRTDTLLLGASVLLTVLAILLSLARLLPTAQRAAILAARATALALLLVGSSAAYALAVHEIPTWVVVVAGDDAPVRFEPTAAGTEHFRAAPGTLLVVEGEREGWLQIARRDGTRGWIERGAVAPLEPAAGAGT